MCRGRKASVSKLHIKCWIDRGSRRRWSSQSYRRTAIDTTRKPLSVEESIVIDIKIEVDTHLLEEVVAQSDKADFDGHLKVLQGSQLTK